MKSIVEIGMMAGAVIGLAVLACALFDDYTSMGYHRRRATIVGSVGILMLVPCGLATAFDHPRATDAILGILFFSMLGAFTAYIMADGIKNLVFKKDPSRTIAPPHSAVRSK